MDNFTLLYVEDDEETVEDVNFFLKRHFCEIIVAQDGEEALQCFENNSIDIVLLDIYIPKIDGLKLASLIRKRNKKIPIIFLTAYSDTKKLLEAINVRAYKYIIKPFMIEELIETINICKEDIFKQERANHIKILSDNFMWNQEKKELFFENSKIPLTKNEIMLIDLFVRYNNKTFSIEDINECIFNNNIKTNSIIQLISRLKKKTTSVTKSNAFFIENIYSDGYKLK